MKKNSIINSINLNAEENLQITELESRIEFSMVAIDLDSIGVSRIPICEGVVCDKVCDCVAAVCDQICDQICDKVCDNIW